MSIAAAVHSQACDLACVIDSEGQRVGTRKDVVHNLDTEEGYLERPLIRGCVERGAEIGKRADLPCVRPLRLARLAQEIPLRQNKPFFVVNEYLFAANKPFFVVNECLFVANKPFFVINEYLFVADKTFFVANEHLFAANKPFFVINECLFVANKPFFIAKKHLFAADKGFFVTD
ncbi:MAG TPA: hypothetical protein VE422_03300 [Terriglobia bacterium]|nr:hypothetical protein [Terriglobia bacterium]